MSCTIPCCRLKPTSPQPQIIDEQPGPVVPAGHSCSGAVITEAASHEKVAALGKIAAFVPDAGPGIEMRPQSWAPRQSTERRRRSPMTLAGLTVSTPPLAGMCRRLGDRVSAQSHQLCAGFGQACHVTDAAHSEGGSRAPVQWAATTLSE